MLRRLQHLTPGRIDAADSDGSPRKLSLTDDRVGFGLFAGHVLTIFGLALSNGLMGLMMLWTGWRRRSLSWRWTDRTVLFVPALVYLVFYVGSIASSLDPLHSLDELRDILTFGTLFLAPVLVYDAVRARLICNGLVGLGIVVSAVGLAQFYFTDYGELHRRIVGPFSHVQTYSGILLILLLVTVARLTRDGRRSLWLWPALALLIWTLLLTLTRGAWVAAVLALAGFGLVRAGRRFPAYALVAAILLAIMVASAPRQAAERVSSIVDLQDSSNYDRLCMAEAALFMVQESPLFGIGPEMVEDRYPIYRHPTAPRVQIPHLHNTYLQRAAEQGLLGLGAYFWLTLAALYLAWNGYRRAGPETSDLHLAALLVVVGFSIAGLFEDNWRDTEVRRLLLFFMALPLCLHTSSQVDRGDTA
ncbi:MAG: O-antigen ligase family protein [Thermoanaerobaculia bacterium]|nr:O-antigen ligase family protein [Thermoanaerobaculia bacterium]